MHRISPGDHRIEVDARDAMRNKLFLAAIEQDLSALQIGDSAVLDAKDIARPDGGQHTGASYSEPDFAKTASHLSDQLTA